MTIIAIIAILAILYILVTLLLQIPGCTGNCEQGRRECDCPLGKNKNDIR